MHLNLRGSSPMVRFRLPLPAILGLILLLTGCSSMNFRSAPAIETIKAARAGGGQMYRVPVMLSQVPETPNGHRLGALYLESLVQAIENENGRIDPLAPGEAGFPAFMAGMPKSVIGGTGAVADRAMQAARQQGFQGVVLAAVTDLRFNNRNWGFLWFRRTNYYLTFGLTVDLYDPFTGAKLVSRLKETVLKIDADEYERLQEESVTEVEALDEAMTDTAEEFGELVADQMARQPWKASVTAVQNGTLRLAADRDASLSPDGKVAIYEARRELRNRFGQKFIVPGAKIAEARIARVGDGFVEVVLEENADVKPGDIAVHVP